METVSFTISNALYCLMLHPEYQDRLYDELIALYPDKVRSFVTIHCLHG